MIRGFNAFGLGSRYIFPHFVHSLIAHVPYALIDHRPTWMVGKMHSSYYEFEMDENHNLFAITRRCVWSIRCDSMNLHSHTVNLVMETTKTKAATTAATATSALTAMTAGC